MSTDRTPAEVGAITQTDARNSTHSHFVPDLHRPPSQLRSLSPEILPVVPETKQVTNTVPDKDRILVPGIHIGPTTARSVWSFKSLRRPIPSLQPYNLKGISFKLHFP